MSVLQTIQISPEVTALSKPLFGKLRYQSLYLTTSLTTLLLLQACCGGGRSVTLDDETQDVDDDSSSLDDDSDDNSDDNSDDDSDDGIGDGAETPAEVQPPSAADIIKILKNADNEDENGADWGEVVHNARANGNYTSNAGHDVVGAVAGW